MGPDSSGSEPGPACYGRGGTEPTVTDADLILGYLDARYFLGGRMALDVAAAEQAIDSRLAQPLGLDVARAAWTVHQVVNESMANAARVHAVERGRDARAFPLFALGGAGPVHAYRVAQKLGVKEVIAPFRAGVGSTIVLLAAPLAFDFVRTAAARHLLGHFLAGMVLAALSPVLPDRAMVEGMAGLWSTNVHGTGPDGNRFTLLSFLSGGTGARRGLDGLSSTAFPSGVSGILTEVFENRSPLVMLEREFRRDSGGPGVNRGGLGHRIVYSGLRLNQPYRLSPFTDRVRHPAPGLEGGLPGAAGEFHLADGTRLNPKRTVELAPDQLLVIGLPGGGGLGDSRERDPELVRQDVLDGLVSVEQARDAYGVLFTADGLVDSAETDKIRP